MNTSVSSLDSSVLAHRLGELAGDERNIQVEFLLHLDEFDRRRAHLELGFGSLWDYCLHALHLREGAAGRRIGAMRVLRRFPQLEPALRDGRLCLSTLSLLGQVLTAENVDELVARAAFRTKAEVDHLVASLRPREAPRDGLRRSPQPTTVNEAVPAVSIDPREPAAQVASASPVLALTTPGPIEVEPPPRLPAAGSAPARSAEVRPVSEAQWSLRVTLDSACKEELETLKALVSHKVPNGDLSAVLREAIRCGIEKHGKRKGAVEPARRRAAKSAPSSDPRAVPAAVRREVWKRDGGSCSWVGEDGRRCGSRWQLELDHVRPPLLGGSSTLDNLRLACRRHNMLHAEQVYGRKHMDRFRRGSTTIAGDSPAAPSGTAGHGHM